MNRSSLAVDLFAAAERDLTPQLQVIPGFVALQVVQASELEAILLIFGDSAATLERVATDVGSPWMGANVVPLPFGTYSGSGPGGVGVASCVMGQESVRRSSRFTPR